MIASTILDDLTSYVPALIARRLVAGPATSLMPAVERFPAAVLFADISGFTALTELLAQRSPSGAEEVTRLLNAYFGHLVDIVTSHGGDVVKFAGDGLLAFWHADMENLPAATHRAVQCGLAVQMVMAPGAWIVSEGEPDPPQPLQVRIGIGAGMVTTMHLGGVFNRWELLVTGAPLLQMGIAQQQAHPGDVIISPEAWALVCDVCIGRPVEERRHGLTERRRQPEIRLSEGLERRRGPADRRQSEPNRHILPATGCVRLEELRDLLPLRPLIVPPLSPQHEPSLRSYVPKAILSRLNAGQTGWLAELRRVTVLFINLPDLTDTIPLDQAQAAMRAIQAALYRYEGSINRLGTDEKGPTLVAALGLPPLAHEDDAERGVQAALAIHAALAGLGMRSAIGVATGRAFCGAVGSARRREYTMMGTIVNLSARLMQAAAALRENNSRQPQEASTLPGVSHSPAQLLCDEATYLAATDRTTFEPLPALIVKGRSVPVAVYRPISDTLSLQAKIPNPQSNIQVVGRAEERALLTQQLHTLFHSGQGGVVVIEGDAGIGKSRLVDDLRQQAEAFGVLTLTGAGSAMEQSAPYHAWRHIFSRLLEGASEPPELPLEESARREHISSRPVHLSSILLEQITPDLHRLAPLLGAVLSLDIPDNEITAQMTGQARAKNTRHLLLQLLQSWVGTPCEQSNGSSEPARGAPLLLIMEDAQWLDSASWSLALALAQHIRPEDDHGLPILFIIATRPLEDLAPEAYRHLVQDPGTLKVQLSGMTPAEILTLLSRRLGVGSLPLPVGRLIHEKAQGNPFFSEELIFALRDNGKISITHGVCELVADTDGLYALRLPDTVQGVITSRIDQLTPSQQMTLKVASVIGETFSLRTVRDIHPVETERPYQDSYLVTLQIAGLVIPLATDPEPSYSFKHTIIRDVTYNLMLFSQRRQLHQAVAEWYERTYAHDLSAFYSQLAYHWEQANVPAKALAYLDKAADLALRSGAYEETITFLDKALALDEAAQRYVDTVIENPSDSPATTPLLQRARWERLLGEAYYGLGQLTASRTHLEWSVTLLGWPAPATQDQLSLSLLSELFRQALRRISPIKFGASGLPPQADTDTEALLEVARAYEMLTPLYYYDSRALPTIHAAVRSVNCAERAGPSSELAHAYAAMQVISGAFKFSGLARIYDRKAEATARQIGQLPALAQVFQARGLYRLGIGDWDKAEAALLQATALADKVDDHRRWVENQGLLALVAACRGQFAQAAAICVEVTASAQRYGDAQAQIWGRVGQAECLLPADQTDEALRLLSEAESLLLTNLNQSNAEKIWFCALQGLAQLRQQDTQSARLLIDGAANLIARSPPITIYALSAYTGVVEAYLSLWEKQRHRSDAILLATIERARRLLASLRGFALVFPIARPRAWLWQGLYHWLDGKTFRARYAWRKSLAAAERLAMPYEQGRAHYEIGRHASGARRRAHLQRAIALFERLGATYDLERARLADEE